MQPTASNSLRHQRPGPAPFVCCYINGCTDVSPLLLAIDSAHDVGALLTLARAALEVTNTRREGGLFPMVCFQPDGVVLPKVTRMRAVAPGSVLILGCGEPFDAASVPARARRMHVTQQRRLRELGPLVRAPPPPRSSSPLPSKAPEAESLHVSPWRFSPSGRWESPLALRPDRL